MAKRIKKEKSDYQKALREYRRHSERHVLVLETRMSHPQKCAVFHIADLERKAGNELVRIIKNRLSQLFRTKRYRKLRRLYGMYRNRKDNENAKLIADEMTGMENKYGVTKEACDAAMIRLYKRYGIYSVFAMTKAESIWGAVKRKLYSDGKELHFSRRGELPSIRAKQIDRGISLFLKDGELRFAFNGEEFGVRDNGKDRFITEEMSAISEYLLHPEESDMYAVRKMQQNGEVIPTFRPCYVSLVCKTIRGRMRVFAHITVEGRAITKCDRNGNPRHGFGTGPVGCDIGTQTIAYTSDSKVGLENLAERGPSILENERKERILYRAMDRSRRATNKENYNKDGTIRKGPKKWHFSKRYRKLKAEHSELCRINAENRHLAINEQVNRIRELGNIFVTEKKNAKRLQKRAKETTLNANGRINRKKRFGKSIRNRCPGYFQLQARNKFERTGGAYIEVPDSYRASQYDHIGDVFVKKKLSQRMFQLEDGTMVQRDWYSSFLLYNIDIKEQTINKNRCRNNFEWQYQRERNMISDIIVKGKKILNSGIRTPDSEFRPGMTTPGSEHRDAPRQSKCGQRAARSQISQLRQKDVKPKSENDVRLTHNAVRRTPEACLEGVVRFAKNRNTMEGKLKHYRVSVEVTALDAKAQRELSLGVDVETDAKDEKEAYRKAVPELVKKDLEQDGLELVSASPFGSSDTEVEEI